MVILLRGISTPSHILTFFLSSLNDSIATLGGLKSEIVRITGTTDSSGIIAGITVTNAYTITPFILSNISDNYLNPYSITVSQYDGNLHTIGVRFRNTNDHSVVTGVGIQLTALLIGV